MHTPCCSTILPVPYAFSKIGILVGTLTMLLVASVNDATCCMLIRASAATGRYTYEELAEWAGGKRAKVCPLPTLSQKGDPLCTNRHTLSRQTMVSHVGLAFQVTTQASLICLLYGTMCGGLAFLSDVARIMVQKGLPSGTAPALLENDGR